MSRLLYEWVTLGRTVTERGPSGGLWELLAWAGQGSSHLCWRTSEKGVTLTATCSPSHGTKQPRSQLTGTIPHSVTTTDWLSPCLWTTGWTTAAEDCVCLDSKRMGLWAELVFVSLAVLKFYSRVQAQGTGRMLDLFFFKDWLNVRNLYWIPWAVSLFMDLFTI